MATRRTKSWWTEEGTEVCSLCLQTYHYGTEYRCEGCDMPVCPDCCVAAGGKLHACDGCAQEAEDNR